MGSWQSIIAAAAISATFGVSAAAQTFTADEFRALGQQNLQSGNLAAASSIVNALLSRDNNDVATLILGAQIATAAGDHKEAARLAKRAYWRTATDNDSFVAARMAANSHAALEQDTFAQLWLRRARQYSPNDAASEGIARDYVFLRNRNPWSNQLSFGVSPTSNVNGGGSGVIPVFGGQAFVEKPLPGLEFTGSFSTTYRIESAETYATFVDLFSNIRTYHLLPEANRLEPDAVGSDYASGAVGIGLRHRQVFREGARPTDLSLRFAQNWSKGVVDTRTLDLGIGQNWTLSDESSITVNLSNQYLLEKNNEPATSVGATTTWSTKLTSSSTVFSLSPLSLRRASIRISISSIQIS